MKLLLVEDEKELSDILLKGLRKCGYAVDAAYDGEEALSCYEVNEYDLLILDLNLPGLDGLEVLKGIRAGDTETKVLILSARSQIEDRVLGLDMGANDYLVKPFDFTELEARIRTLLRVSFTQRPSVLTCGTLKLDTLSRTCFEHLENTENSKKEKVFSLTKKEYAILEYLMLHKNCVISSEQLIEHVWDSEADLFSNSLKYHIHAIKKKLGQGFSCAGLLQNIRGQGYVLTEENHEIT